MCLCLCVRERGLKCVFGVIAFVALSVCDGCMLSVSICIRVCVFLGFLD